MEFGPTLEDAPEDCVPNGVKGSAYGILGVLDVRNSSTIPEGGDIAGTVEFSCGGGAFRGSVRLSSVVWLSQRRQC